MNRKTTPKCLVGLIVIVFLFAVGCKKKGEESESPLSPPSWIQGTWSSEKSNLGYWGQWIFTANNAIYKSYINDEYIATNYLQIYLDWDEDTYGQYILSDTSSDTYYEIHEYTEYYGHDNYYKLTKLTPTTILFASTTNGWAIGDPFVFTKQ